MGRQTNRGMILGRKSFLFYRGIHSKTTAGRDFGSKDRHSQEIQHEMKRFMTCKN